MGLRCIFKSPHETPWLTRKTPCVHKRRGPVTPPSCGAHLHVARAGQMGSGAQVNHRTDAVHRDNSVPWERGDQLDLCRGYDSPSDTAPSVSPCIHACVHVMCAGQSKLKSGMRIMYSNSNFCCQGESGKLICDMLSSKPGGAKQACKRSARAPWDAACASVSDDPNPSTS